MPIKSMPWKIKAVGTDDGLNAGEFKALVSVFGNKDSYGDIVKPGAFTKTLKEWEASGDPIPVYWSHQLSDPDYNIGSVLSAAETDKGLEVHAAFDLDGASKAQQVYRLMKGRRVTQFSFSYSIVDGGWVKDGEPLGEDFDPWDAFGDGDIAYELRELKLFEVGPTPVGANQETELIDVKAFTDQTRRFAYGVKAGRVLSAANETTLRDASEQLKGALSSIDQVLSVLKDDDGKATDAGPAKDKAPSGGKSEEPRRPSAADLLALHTITTT